MKKEKSDLEKEIENLLNQMKDLKPSNPAYATYADQLVKLYKLKEVDSKSHVSADALLSAGASFVALAMVLFWEHGHPIASKAFSHTLNKFK